MSSNEPSDSLLDLDRDLPTTAEDVTALRRNRPASALPWWEQLQRLIDQVPDAAEQARRRPVFSGPPFEL